MTPRKLTIIVLFLIVTILSGCSGFNHPAKQVTVSALFGSNMVLQRGMKLPVWGTAEPGGQVRVELGSFRKQGTAGKDGKWKVVFNPLPAGGPYTLKIIGRDTTSFRNVMVGEVWLCSGQSNMEMPLGGWGKIRNYKQEIAAADYPTIRLFQVEKTMSTRPDSVVRSDGWKVCSPETVPEFSAAAYFFGRNLSEKLHVPIGLIESAWGGTVVEAWTSAASLDTFPEFTKILQEMKTGQFSKDRIFTVYQKKLAGWRKQVFGKIARLGDFKAHWESPQLDDSGWKTMRLPTFWERAGFKNLDGVVWFRKTVTLPASWQGKGATLSLGPVNDADNTYFNGMKVGGLSYHEWPRRYPIPDSLIHAGKNVIAVQVLDIGGKGGLYGKPEQLKLISQTGASVSLAGPWRFHISRIALDAKKLPRQPSVPRLSNQPSVLFNAMIAPLIPFPIRGVIWYQGESNADRAYQYRKLFKALIQDWRNHWGEGDFPFLFVQLANYMPRKPEPSEDAWAELREAQTMALSLPNTGMAVTIDIGNAKDIHPKNKQEVGRRLALIARHLVYGDSVDYSGPMYQSMTIEGNRIRLKFSHVDGGLITKGENAPVGFAIAGADHKFYWARAKIDGPTVVVWNPNVLHPVAVRYAWASNPKCNLYNRAGLPASPFRTDNWDGITKGNK
ncbi:MAG: 9-O-acetylesterase [Calditrichaeota bacterium]|nr:9-O-acetylesterase [Calditrichota bacterium]